MEIGFKNTRLKRICEDEQKMSQKLGAKSAKKLKSRLADLSAAGDVNDLIAGRPHPLKGDRLGQFALYLDGGDRLVFESADEPVPTTTDGAIDWKRVTKICIVYIGDYHG